MQPNWHGSAQVLANARTPIDSVAARIPAYSSASAEMVATMLCCFVQALIRCFPCRTLPSLTDFLDRLSHAQSASARACKALG